MIDFVVQIKFLNLIYFCLFRKKKYKYIDVWPVNFFTPTKNDLYDTSSLFMMQLACIIKMIAVYKKHTLRVHLLNTIDIQSQRVQLKLLLSTLRINASIHEVSIHCTANYMACIADICNDLLYILLGFRLVYD